MAYTKRGPWVDGQPFTADDANAWDDAIAQFNGRTVVDLGDIAGPVTIDCNVGEVFRANLTADAALTVTNAATAGLSRSTELMLSTNGYVPTFAGVKLPKPGLSGDYVGVIDRFVVETNPGQNAPLVRHVAGYGRYRAAFVGIAGTHVQASYDGHNWKGMNVPAATNFANSIAWSPAGKVFVQLLILVDSPRQYGITTSRDGVNWTRQAFTFASTNPSYLIFNRHTGMLNIFTGDGQTMYESLDGRVWATRTLTGLDRPIRQMDWSPILGVYAAADFGQYRLTSTDGLAWTKSTGNTDQAETMRWVDAWGIFVATGDTFVNTSANNTVWTRRFMRTIPDYSMSSVEFSDSKAVITVASASPGISNAAYVSTDSATWGLVEPPFQFHEAAASPVWNRRLGMWLMLYGSSPSSGVMYQTSDDAVTWDDPAAFDPAHLAPNVIVSGD